MSASNYVGRVLWFVLATVSCASSPASAEDSSADHGIRLVREIALERGLVAQPKAIAVTHDGGYVVAGLVGTHGGAWAVRLAASGEVQWRHVVPNDSGRPGDQGPQYTGVAVLPDDSVVLCGYQQDLSVDRFKIVGLLTRVDRTGKVLSKRTIEPTNGKAYALTYLRRAVVTADGALIYGTTNEYAADSVRQGWIVKIGADGDVKSEAMLPGAGGLLGAIIGLSDGTLVLSTLAGLKQSGVANARRITRIDGGGLVKATRIISGDQLLMHSVLADLLVRLVPSSPRPASVRTLGDSLQDLDQRSGAALTILSKRAYYLPDGSALLFGAIPMGRNSSTAGVAWISSDLERKREYIFRPEFLSNEVTDAVPTGAAGEFAAVRPVVPTTPISESNKNWVGAALTIFAIH